MGFLRLPGGGAWSALEEEIKKLGLAFVAIGDSGLPVWLAVWPSFLKKSSRLRPE